MIRRLINHLSIEAIRERRADKARLKAWQNRFAFHKPGGAK